ncbi:hypothetical protein HDU97_005161 [Phlyctochytrium planicorne]|nr:hypothetical protein HDU97_005161 [Phlyctochytrium planicorne]
MDFEYGEVTLTSDDELSFGREPVAFQIPSDGSSYIPIADTSSTRVKGGVVHLTDGSRPCLILWRLLANHRVLELKAIPLTQSKEKNVGKPDTFQVAFPATCIPTIAVYQELETGQVHILAVTVAGKFYRMVFTSVLELLVPTTTFPAGITSFQMLNEEDSPATIISVNFPDVDTICVGLSNGTVRQIDCIREAQGQDSYVQHVLSHISPSIFGGVMATPIKMLKRFNVLPSNSTAEAVTVYPRIIESVQHNSSLLAFALFSDSTIKIFDLDSRRHLETIHLNNSIIGDALPLAKMSTANSKTCMKICLQKLEETSFGMQLTFKLVLFQPFIHQSDNSFHFYSVTLNPNGSLRACVFIGSISASERLGSILVDFALTSETEHIRLWSLWQGESYRLKYIDICLNPEAFGPVFGTWHHLCTQQRQDFSTLEHADDLKESFASVLAVPGRYSSRLLRQALFGYLEDRKLHKELNDLRVQPLETANVATLIVIILEGIDAGLLRILKGQDPATFKSRLLFELQGFLSICEDLLMSEIQPIGLYPNHPLHVLFILRRGSLAVVRPATLVESLYRFKTTEFPEKTRLENLEQFGECLRATNSILEHVPAAAVRSFFERLVMVLQKSADPKSIDAETKTMFQDVIACYLDESVLQSIRGALNTIENLDSIFSDLLDSLLENEEDQDQMQEATLSEIPSDFLKSILSTSFFGFSSELQDVSKDLVFLGLLHGHLEKSGRSASNLKAIHLFHRSILLNWLAISTLEHFPLDRELSAFSPRLVHVLIENIVPWRVDSGRLNLPTEISQELLRFSEFILEGSSFSGGNILRMAVDVAKIGIHHISNEILSFLSSRFAVDFLVGKNFLALEDFSEASAYFSTAYRFFYSGLSANDKSEIKAILPDIDVDWKPIEFLEYLIDIFTNAKAYNLVIEFVDIATVELKNPLYAHVADEKHRLFWKSKFSACLASRSFDLACEALADIPISESPKYFLRNLITSLCVNGDFLQLVSGKVFLPFHTDVEETLKFQANTCDFKTFARALPGQSKDPNYHKILYAFYISKGEYRKASSILLNYARLLGTITADDLHGKSNIAVATEQARMYLSAINALSLVDADYAWFTHSETSGSRFPANSAKKRRLELGEEVEEAEVKVTEERSMITLLHIKREYTLCVSKLLLLQRHSEYAFIAGLPTAQDVLVLSAISGNIEWALTIAELFSLDIRPAVSMYFEHRLRILANDPRPFLDADGKVPDHVAPYLGGPNWVKTSKWLRYLVDFLDLRENGYSYRSSLSEMILKEHLLSTLPIWLDFSMMVSNPALLLRAYVRSGNLKVAGVVAKEMIEYEKVLKSTSILPKHSSRWLPYYWIDKVAYGLERLVIDSPADSDNAFDPELEKVLQGLLTVLDSYLEKVEHLSAELLDKDLASITKPRPTQKFKVKIQLPEDRSPAAKPVSQSLLSRLGPKPDEEPQISKSLFSRLGPSVGSTSTSSTSIPGSATSAPQLTSQQPLFKPAALPPTNLFGSLAKPSAPETNLFASLAKPPMPETSLFASLSGSSSLGSGAPALPSFTSSAAPFSFGGGDTLALPSFGTGPGTTVPGQFSPQGLHSNT